MPSSREVSTDPRAVILVEAPPTIPVALHAGDLDAEDELIRALGVPAVLDVVDERGDSAASAAPRRQPFHRDHPEHQVLHRFLGTTSGRKTEYAGLLTTPRTTSTACPSLWTRC
jgi:hypothetical protein